MISAHAITGLVLAGGQGSRMGGADKGLQIFEGMPLAARALARLRPQVGACRVSANRNLAAYRALGVPVWPDAEPDAEPGAEPGAEPDAVPAAPAFHGPLAGLLAGLTHCTTPWLLAVPCDAPWFPEDLASRLGSAVGAGESARMAIAWGWEAAPGKDATLRPQPVFCLMHRSLRDSLAAYLATGGRKAGAWAAQAGAARVDFDDPQRDGAAFANLNTLGELQTLAYAEPAEPAEPAGLTRAVGAVGPVRPVGSIRSQPGPQAD